VREVEVHA